MSNGILTSGWLPLAHLLRPQGRRGELLAEPLSDLPGLFVAGREAFLSAPGTTSPAPNSTTIHIEDHWFPTGKNAGRIVLKLSGCDTISAAEALAGKHLLIAASDLPTLAPDTFFVGDLVGCTLFDSSAPGDPIPVGIIVDLEFATAPDGRTRLEDAAPLLAVTLSNPNPTLTHDPTQSADLSDPTEPTLVPFVRAWLNSVDIPARRITMRLPQGLLPDPPRNNQSKITQSLEP
jgi:16S rRNA processing protein RimM